jgi:tetratricopeptide (TPR) repeat protein
MDGISIVSLWIAGLGVLFLISGAIALFRLIMDGINNVLISYLEKSGDTEDLPKMLLDRAWERVNTGETSRAITDMEKALAKYQELGDIEKEVFVLSLLSQHCYITGDFERTEKYCAAAYRMSGQAKDYVCQANALITYAELKHFQNKNNEAKKLLSKALTITIEKAHDEETEILILKTIADILICTGEHKQAKTTLDQAVNIVPGLELNTKIVESMDIVTLYAMAGFMNEAQHYLKQVQSIAEEHIKELEKSPGALLVYGVVQGAALRATGKSKEAMELLDNALYFLADDTFLEFEGKLLKADYLMEKGRLKLSINRPDQASAAFDAAFYTYRNYEHRIKQFEASVLLCRAVVGAEVQKRHNWRSKPLALSSQVLFERALELGEKLQSPLIDEIQELPRHFHLAKTGRYSRKSG